MIDRGATIIGMVAAVAVAAFLGGYVLGSFDEPAVTNEDLAHMLEEMREAPSPQRESTPRPEPVPVSADDDPVKGNPDAAVTIIEFSDFQCPFCQRFYLQTLPQLEREYIETGKVNLVYRDMPLRHIHPNAVPAHVAAECADEQGRFWEYHDILFERVNEWGKIDAGRLASQLKAYADEIGLDSSFDACVTTPEMLQEVQDDYRHATQYGITGTPSFFIGNDDGYESIYGAQPYTVFKQIIDSKLG